MGLLSRKKPVASVLPILIDSSTTNNNGRAAVAGLEYFTAISPPTPTTPDSISSSNHVDQTTLINSDNNLQNSNQAYQHQDMVVEVEGYELDQTNQQGDDSVAMFDDEIHRHHQIEQPTPTQMMLLPTPGSTPISMSALTIPSTSTSSRRSSNHNITAPSISSTAPPAAATSTRPVTPISSSSSMTILTSAPSTLIPIPSITAPTSQRKTSSRYNLADFTFLRTLGTGSFGRVHLVRSLHNSRSYAVKVLSKDRVVKMKQVEHTNSEREMLERVRHPFLVNLWGTFQCPRNLYMVMDFVAGGELFSLLRKSQRFPDPVAKFYAAEVALALDYLHSLDIIYRDLKPENILLGADGHVKITDFGFAKYVPDITWTLCGTPDYLAPEIVQSRGYNKSVDWYALGVLMFEMLAGYPPFFTEDTNPMRLYEKIIQNKVRYPSYFTSPAISLLRSLLTADLSKRFGNLARGSTDIFSHEWFQEVDWETLYRKEIPAPYVPKIEGEWDSSNFDTYSEIDVSEYGKEGVDGHRALFLAF